MTTSLPVNDELLVGFIDEAIHGLRQLPDQIAAYRRQPQNAAPIHAVFRTVHSIKGNAGFFGLHAIKKFAHVLENTLDEVRNQRLEFSDQLHRAMVEALDHLEELLCQVVNGVVTAEIGVREQELLSAIERVARQPHIDFDDKQQRLENVTALVREMFASDNPEAQHWAARLQRTLPRELVEKMHAEVEAESVSGQAGICDLRTLCFAHENHDLTAPLLALLTPFATPSGGKFERSHAQEFIAQANLLAEQVSVLGATNLALSLRCSVEHMTSILASPLDLDANTLSIVWDSLWPSVKCLQVAPAAEPPAPIVATPAEPAAAPIVASETATPASAPKARLVRVREEHLEAFVGDVSRLFITGERLKDLHARMSAEKKLSGLVDELKQINAAFLSQTNALQHSVVALRNMPVQALFGKFPRMARTLAANLGKQLDVYLEGEEVGIDKTLIEELDSPLTHMIRNVCDHAIETPSQRLECGKPEQGTLLLKCELTRTHVVITMKDDGRGIDPARIRRKALENQLLSPEQISALSDQEAIDLIFHPGFSTAEQITEVSGRGVGMDVVRSTLRQHDGDVQVTSQVGVGTTFTLTIPIRQAVLVVDGLLLNDGGANYVVPLAQIREIVELDANELTTVQGSPVVVVRGEPLTALSLAQMLQLPHHDAHRSQWQGVVLQTKEGAMCLLTERVVGQRKVVINSLRELLPNVENIAGVAQLGGGKLALVLSPPDLIRALAVAGTTLFDRGHQSVDQGQFHLQASSAP